MKIAVVGTGAMGSVYAVLFAEAGHDVWAIDTWPEHVNAINREGLKLTGFTGDRTVQVKASTSVSDAGVCDMFVLATKVDGVGPAAQAIAPLLSPDATVVTIQNGLGAAERICEHIPSEQVLLGVAQGFGAQMMGAGHAHQNGMQMLRLGELNGGMTDRLHRIEGVWADAGFPVTAFGDIEQLVWEKFICNVAVGGPSLVSGLTIGELVASQDWRPVVMGCATEAHNVALALGVNITYDDPVAYIDTFVAKMPGATPSMRQDYENGRRSELDAINAQVPVVGRRVGVPTPYNDTICATVRSMEDTL
jgi:2-dehydropantoate 2-reductase